MTNFRRNFVSRDKVSPQPSRRTTKPAGVDGTRVSHGRLSHLAQRSGAGSVCDVGVSQLRLVVVIGKQIVLGVVVVVDSGLASVQVGWGDPFGAAVFAFSGAPAALVDEAVVRSAGQGFLIDVGLPAVGPVGLGGLGFRRPRFMPDRSSFSPPMCLSSKTGPWRAGRRLPSRHRAHGEKGPGRDPQGLQPGGRQLFRLFRE